QPDITAAEETCQLIELSFRQGRSFSLGPCLSTAAVQDRLKRQQKKQASHKNKQGDHCLDQRKTPRLGGMIVQHDPSSFTDLNTFSRARPLRDTPAPIFCASTTSVRQSARAEP